MRILLPFVVMLILMHVAFSMDLPGPGDHFTYMEHLTPEENFNNVYKINSLRHWQIVSVEKKEVVLACYETIADRAQDSAIKLLAEILALGLKAISDKNSAQPYKERLLEISLDQAQAVRVTAYALYALGNIHLWEAGPTDIEAREHARSFYVLILALKPADEIEALKKGIEDEIKTLDAIIVRLRNNKQLQAAALDVKLKTPKKEVLPCAISRKNAAQERLRKKLHTQAGKTQLTAQPIPASLSIPDWFEDEEPQKKAKRQERVEPVQNNRAALDAFLKSAWAKEHNLSKATYLEPVLNKEKRSYKATLIISGKKYSGFAANKKAASHDAARVALERLTAHSADTTITPINQEHTETIDVSFREGKIYVAVKGESYTPTKNIPKNGEIKETVHAAPVKKTAFLKPPACSSAKAPYTGPILEPQKIEGPFPPLVLAPVAIPVDYKNSSVVEEESEKLLPQTIDESYSALEPKEPIKFITADILPQIDLDGENKGFGAIRAQLVERYGKKAIFKRIDPALNKIIVNVLDNFVYVHIVEKNEIKSDNKVYAQTYSSLREAENENQKLLKKLLLLRQEKGFLNAEMKSLDDLATNDEFNDAFVISIDLYENVSYDGMNIPFNVYEIPQTANMLIVAPRKKGELKGKKNVIRVIRNGPKGLLESVAKRQKENTAIWGEIKALESLQQ